MTKSQQRSQRAPAGNEFWCRRRGWPGGLDPRGALDRIDELLELQYRSADLGNVSDPLSEAVYILLSQQTREQVYRTLFGLLRAEYPRWSDLADAPVSRLIDVLRPAGFQHRRATQLKGLLAAVRDENRRRGVGPFGDPQGDLTLSFLSDLGDREAEVFLLRLPGLGKKSARCVLSYALGRAAFAVDTHVHRIFSRLGLIPTADRKSDADPFQEFVPPKLRKRLHVNMVHHGRAVCRSTRAACDECVLASFCASRRQHRSASRPVILDLFSGAGGLGLGFAGAGYQVCLAVERDRNAAQTYRLNHPGVVVLEADVTKLLARDVRRAGRVGAVDAVIAGTPCQGYSWAGARKPDDPRNDLFRHVGRLAADLKADVVVLENVRGVNNVNGKRFLPRIVHSLAARGFKAKASLLHAVDFGVPQDRWRYFIIGIRRGIGVPPRSFRPTHVPPGTRSGHCLPETPSLVAVLEDLPKLGPGEDAEYVVGADGRVLLNGSTMRHSAKVVRKIATIPPGGGPISYRRLEPVLARTLVAGHRAMPVHPVLNRTLSVREAARIQGFPDWYTFCGPRGEQPLQVANAVPPSMARAVASQLRKLFGRRACAVAHSGSRQRTA